MIYHCNFVILDCRNVIPTTGSCGSGTSPVEQLDSSFPISAGAALLPLMSSVPSSDADAADGRSAVKTANTSTMSLELTSSELNNSIRLSRSAAIGTGNAYDGYKKPKSRNRKTQLKMLADNLSKFYAPAASGKRRELIAQKRSEMDMELSARERQLEVIRKQVSLVAKRKKAELEMAAAASQGDNFEPSESVHAGDGVVVDSISKQKSVTTRFSKSTRLNKKLRKWKNQHSKLATQRKHKQKLSRKSSQWYASAENIEAEVPTSSESTLLD